MENKYSNQNVKKHSAQLLSWIKLYFIEKNNLTDL